MKERIIIFRIVNYRQILSVTNRKNSPRKMIYLDKIIDWAIPAQKWIKMLEKLIYITLL